MSMRNKLFAVTVIVLGTAPNGEEYSGRGAIPRWARDLGFGLITRS